jgi:signal transduction histidine kinase
VNSLRNTIFHLLSVPILILLIWVAVQLVSYPSIGIFWDPATGVVHKSDLLHPSSGEVHEGDRVLTGYGMSPAEFVQGSGKEEGDTIPFELERNGKTITVPIEVTEPNLWLVIDRLTPLMIAIGFWIAGNTVLAFSRPENFSILFFLVCQGAALSFGSEAYSRFGPPWTVLAFQVGSFWTGAFAVYLHLIFPSRILHRYFNKVGQILLAFCSILPALAFLLYNILGPSSLKGGLSPWVLNAWWAINLSIIAILLVRTCWKSQSAVERVRVGIITLSSLVGIFPFLVFSLVPQWIIGYSYVPPNISFLGLIFLPVGYSYAILYTRMARTQKAINRGATDALIALSMAGVYSIWYALATRYISSSVASSPIGVIVATIIFSSLTNRLHHTFLRFANRVLYGGWYDYQSVVESVSASLNSAEVDNEAIGTTLCQVIGKSMRLEYANLLLPDESALAYLDHRPMQTRRFPSGKWMQVLSRVESLDITHKLFIPWKNTLETELFGDMMETERSVHYLIPLRGKDDQILGILFLGRKCDGESLDGNDLEILKVVVQQAQVTLENIRLLKIVQEQADKNGRLHRQVVRAREEERKRVARDLHDLTIQSLVGINYQIAGIRADLTNLEEITLISTQAEIRQLIGDLRQICYDLRPPSLDVMGLVAAIHSKVAEIEECATFQIRVEIEGAADQEFPDEVRLCIFRFVQESLLNIQKHAQADQVEIRLQVIPEKIIVSVKDDGVGFAPPDQLNDLIRAKHYGLVGLKELVESIDGILAITSRPGEGCDLTAQVPI